MDKLLSILKNIKFLITFSAFAIGSIVAAVLWVHGVSNAMEESKKKQDKLEQTVKQNSDLAVKQQALMERMSDKVDVFVQLYLKLDPSDIAVIKRLPRAMPVDSSGKPKLGIEFLKMWAYDSVTVSNGKKEQHGFPQVGEIVKMTRLGEVMIRTIWDIRE